ncbi:MAG TPA: hypothetical protein VFB29_13605 [Pseudolabrys sp.]|nr:hypothetical protein [Pseudolabrys sp.]
MLSIARKRWHRHAGVLLAAFYLAALATPAAAVVLSADPSHSHCLTEISSLASHEHTADHAAHHQHQPAPVSQQTDQSQNCCGLFGVTAIAPNFVIVAVSMAIASSIAFTPSEDLFGRGFDRIDRPPRSFLSL